MAGVIGPTSSDGRRLSPRFVEWMMGVPDGWSAVDGAAGEWADQHHALGNGVVPQAAALAIDTLAGRIGDDY